MKLSVAQRARLEANSPNKSNSIRINASSVLNQDVNTDTSNSNYSSVHTSHQNKDRVDGSNSSSISANLHLSVDSTSTKRQPPNDDNNNDHHSSRQSTPTRNQTNSKSSKPTSPTNSICTPNVEKNN